MSWSVHLPRVPEPRQAGEPMRPHQMQMLRLRYEQKMRSPRRIQRPRLSGGTIRSMLKAAGPLAAQITSWPRVQSSVDQPRTVAQVGVRATSQSIVGVRFTIEARKDAHDGF